MNDFREVQGLSREPIDKLWRQGSHYTARVFGQVGRCTLPVRALGRVPSKFRAYRGHASFARAAAKWAAWRGESLKSDAEDPLTPAAWRSRNTAMYH